MNIKFSFEAEDVGENGVTVTVFIGKTEVTEETKEEKTEEKSSCYGFRMEENEEEGETE